MARLEGHEAPLMNVECPKSYQIIISLDAKSVMKIWHLEAAERHLDHQIEVDGSAERIALGAENFGIACVHRHSGADGGLR